MPEENITNNEIFEMFVYLKDNMVTKEEAENFATKDDLKNFATKDDLKKEIGQLRVEMEQEFDYLRNDLRGVRNELEQIKIRLDKIDKRTME